MASGHPPDTPSYGGRIAAHYAIARTAKIVYASRKLRASIALPGVTLHVARGPGELLGDFHVAICRRGTLTGDFAQDCPSQVGSRSLHSPASAEMSSDVKCEIHILYVKCVDHICV